MVILNRKQGMKNIISLVEKKKIKIPQDSLINGLKSEFSLQIVFGVTPRCSIKIKEGSSK